MRTAWSSCTVDLLFHLLPSILSVTCLNRWCKTESSNHCRPARAGWALLLMLKTMMMRRTKNTKNPVKFKTLFWQSENCCWWEYVFADLTFMPCSFVYLQFTYNWWKELPVSILRRVAALKVLQNQSEEIDVEYKKERILLEIKYRLMKDPLLNSRSKIVSGEVDVPKSSTDESPGTDSKETTVFVPHASFQPEFNPCLIAEELDLLYSLAQCRGRGRGCWCTQRHPRLLGPVLSEPPRSWGYLHPWRWSVTSEIWRQIIL